jgi:hypothetical protein
LMNNGGYAYFWRHQDNRNRTCNGRNRPIQSALPTHKRPFTPQPDERQLSVSAADNTAIGQL